MGGRIFVCSVVCEQFLVWSVVSGQWSVVGFLVLSVVWFL